MICWNIQNNTTKKRHPQAINFIFLNKKFYLNKIYLIKPSLAFGSWCLKKKILILNKRKMASKSHQASLMMYLRIEKRVNLGYYWELIAISTKNKSNKSSFLYRIIFRIYLKWDTFLQNWVQKWKIGKLSYDPKEVYTF